MFHPAVAKAKAKLVNIAVDTKCPPQAKSQVQLQSDHVFLQK